MIINHNRSFIFIHLQKTGGSFVEKFLLDNFEGCELYKPKHNGITFWNFPDECKNYTKFGCVRNPYDVYVSWWASNSREGAGKLFPKIFEGEKRKSFKKFIEYVMNNNFGKQHDLNGNEIFSNDIGIYTYRYIKAFCNSDIQKTLNDHWANFKMTYVVYTEYLKEGLSAILKLNSKEKEILNNMSKVHTSKHRDYRYYFDSETKELVRRKDRLLFEVYDYAF